MMTPGGRKSRQPHTLEAAAYEATLLADQVHSWLWLALPDSPLGVFGACAFDLVGRLRLVGLWLAGYRCFRDLEE